MLLGKIEPVELRKVWQNEAYEFTPWLASEEGLEYLSDILGVSLQVVGTEQRVGPFKCDIIARIQDVEGEDEGIVVIENQLETTNHDHLGKIITYASGYNAKMLVWIAKEFSEEHRQALDWLNENLSDIYVFGLEIGLIKINNSPPAVQLKTISSPNEWAKAIRTISTVERTETEMEHLQFWQQFKSYANDQTKYPIQFTRKPFPQSWYEFSIGKSGYIISLTRNTIQNRCGCEIYIINDEDKRIFEALLKRKESIEENLEASLEWQRLEGKKASRIIQYNNVEISNQEKWPEIFNWLYDRCARFYEVFLPHIKEID